MPLDKVAELKIKIVFFPMQCILFSASSSGDSSAHKFKQLHSYSSEHHELRMHELNDGQLNFDDLAMQMDR